MDPVGSSLPNDASKITYKPSEQYFFFKIKLLSLFSTVVNVPKGRHLDLKEVAISLIKL